MSSLTRGPDGYYHPATEDEIRDLVLHARARGLQVRVRGSGHSLPQAIYTDGRAWGEEAVDILLDRCRTVSITPDRSDPRRALVEVEAGCHLGKDPYDPTGTASWDVSLNVQLTRRGYALADLGGISHQTVSGFLSTGSAGGSIKHSVYDDIVGLRLIDGTGRTHDLRADDPDPAKRDLFHAAGVSLGLFGVITRVWLRAGPLYNIQGTQVTGPTHEAAMDLFGGGTPEKPSLAEFLKRTPYARLMWWPQTGFSRVQVWQAARLEPAPGFEPRPYEELGRFSRLSSLAGSLLYTLIGNVDDLSAVHDKLGPWFSQLEAELEGKPDENACYGREASRSGVRHTLEDVLADLRARIARALAGHEPVGQAESPLWLAGRALAAAVGAPVVAGLHDALAHALVAGIERLLTGQLDRSTSRILAEIFDDLMPHIIQGILAPFVPDGSQHFQDSWMCGLPMDNQMDDQLWPVKFTELWIPIDRAEEAMRRLAAYYAGGDGTAKGAYGRTGAFSCELYGAAGSPFWLSPAYGGPVLRVDVFWFGLNAADPSYSFFPGFWGLLKDLGFRPHWGKCLPPATDLWREHYRKNLPRLGDFLRLRAEMDPGQVFVSSYWREHLGIDGG